MADKGAVRPVLHPGLQPVVGLRQGVEIAAEILAAKAEHHLLRIVHGHRLGGIHVKKMRRADHILRSCRPLLRVEAVELRAGKDLQPAPVLLPELPDLLQVSRHVHMDVRVHVPGKAKMGKPDLQRALRHLPGRIGSVAHRRMRVIIAAQFHPFPSCPAVNCNLMFIIPSGAGICISPKIC